MDLEGGTEELPPRLKEDADEEGQMGEGVAWTGDGGSCGQEGGGHVCRNGVSSAVSSKLNLLYFSRDSRIIQWCLWEEQPSEVCCF